MKFSKAVMDIESSSFVPSSFLSSRGVGTIIIDYYKVWYGLMADTRILEVNIGFWGWILIFVKCDLQLLLSMYLHIHIYTKYVMNINIMVMSSLFSHNFIMDWIILMKYDCYVINVTVFCPSRINQKKKQKKRMNFYLVLLLSSNQRWSPKKFLPLMILDH